jgi:nucleoside-specific outer membrane channel protein Tsx
MLNKLLVSSLLVGASFSCSPVRAQFQDNAFRYRYSSAFREPDTNNGNNVAKNIINFTHVDSGYKLGNNFLTVDLLKSSTVDPVSDTSDSGATEIYIIYRHDISLNKITHSTKFSFGPVKDVLVTAGLDLNAKNNAFGPRRRVPVFGPSFDLKIPRGYWKISLLWNKEWNHDGYVEAGGGGVEFNSAAMVSTVWVIPFKVVKIPLYFEGFALMNSTKGYDNTGSGTKPETLLRPKLMHNFGQLFGKKCDWQIGFGYEYWNNKYGEDHHLNPGSVQNAPMLEAAVHF